MRRPSVSPSSTRQVILPPNTAPVSMAMRLWRTTGSPHRRVPVHHHSAERHLRVEERLAHAQQVLTRLLLQRNARTHAAMDKEIAAIPMGQRKSAQEVEMFRRYLFGPALARRVRIDAVALQGGAAAGEQPIGRRRAIA